MFVPICKKGIALLLGGLKDIIPLAGALFASSAKDIIVLWSGKDIMMDSSVFPYLCNSYVMYM
jgi:hypothetical protein